MFTAKISPAAFMIVVLLLSILTMPQLAFSNDTNDEPTRYIVYAEPGERIDATTLRGHATTSTRQVQSTDSVMVVEGDAQLGDELRSNPDIQHVVEDFEVKPLGQTTPWGVEQINAPQTHGHIDSSAARICVIDSTVDDDHRDLNVIASANFADSPQSADFHGTHVAGTAAAIDNQADVLGTSDGAGILSANIYNSAGTANWSTVVDAISWCMRHDADVVNMSLGIETHFAPQQSPILSQFADETIFVAASGNRSDQHYFPSVDPNTISVGASDTNGQRTDFTSPGWDVLAPGVGIESTIPGDATATSDGTSMAAPHVSGAAAILSQTAETMTTSQARQVLQSTANDDVVDVAAAYEYVTDESLPEPDPSPPGDGDEPSENVHRLSGSDRIATAIEVSREFWPNGANTVFIANAYDFPDALVGGAAAARRDAPILLVPPDHIPDHVASELDRLDPNDVTVLGGRAAVDPAVDHQLQEVVDA